jgi:hypothetical protein
MRRVLGAKVLILKPSDPEAKELLERCTATWRPRSCPAGRSPARRTSTLSLGEFFARASRWRWSMGCAPADRIAADRAATCSPPASPAQSAPSGTPWTTPYMSHDRIVQDRGHPRTVLDRPRRDRVAGRPLRALVQHHPPTLLRRAPAPSSSINSTGSRKRRPPARRLPRQPPSGRARTVHDGDDDTKPEHAPATAAKPSRLHDHKLRLEY